MAPNLQVGQSIATAMVKIIDITMVLQSAADAAAAADTMVNMNKIYKGAAEPELQVFYSNYSANIQKLMYYYTMACQYLQYVSEQMEILDQDLTQMVMAAADGMAADPVFGDVRWTS